MATLTNPESNEHSIPTAIAILLNLSHDSQFRSPNGLTGTTMYLNGRIKDSGRLVLLRSLGLRQPPLNANIADVDTVSCVS
jgi:hypothetical protein